MIMYKIANFLSETEHTYDIKVIIAMLCGITVMILGMIFLVIKRRVTKVDKFIEKAKQRGDVTQGRCVNTKRRMGTYDRTDNPDVREDSLVVTYEYFVNGNKYKKNYVYSSSTLDIDYPFTIDLYYDRNNPKKVHSQGEVSKKDQETSGCLLTIVLTIATCAIVYNLLNFLFK